MEVTQKNFDEVLKFVQASIKKSDFLVIDAEFTGLRKFWKVSRFDLPKEYYFKLLKGIGYMPELEENNQRKIFEEQNYSYQKATIPVPEKDKNTVDDICNNIRKFLHKNESETLELDTYNLFMERLLSQEINIRFKDEVFVEVIMTENKKRVLKVSKISSEKDREVKNKQQKERQQKEFDAALGFTKVARMIRDSGKLVVGHNMLLDIVHTLGHFFDKLPEDYSDFKTIAHQTFPRLIDTKYISSTATPFKEKVNINSLPLLMLRLSEAPFSMPKVAAETGRGYTGAENEEHRAGYDAYVTGMCFLAMHKYLARMHGDERVDTTSTIFRPYLNKLYLSRTADQGSPCMNLAGDDPLPSRDHVFYVSFPKGWQNEELKMAFRKYGEITEDFLGQNTAVIALSRKELASTVERDFARRKEITLKRYDTYMYVNAKSTTSVKLQTPSSASYRPMPKQ